MVCFLFYGGFGYEKCFGFELNCKRYACLIYVVTLINESTQIRIYIDMARLVVKMDTKDTCFMMRLDYVLKLQTSI